MLTRDNSMPQRQYRHPRPAALPAQLQQPRRLPLRHRQHRRLVHHRIGHRPDRRLASRAAPAAPLHPLLRRALARLGRQVRAVRPPHVPAQPQARHAAHPQRERRPDHVRGRQAQLGGAERRREPEVHSQGEPRHRDQRGRGKGGSE